MTFTEPEVNDPLVINTQITLSVPASDLLPAALQRSVSPILSLTMLCQTHIFEDADKRVKIADLLCVILLAPFLSATTISVPQVPASPPFENPNASR
jgi:hypothetical protein